MCYTLGNIHVQIYSHLFQSTPKETYVHTQRYTHTHTNKLTHRKMKLLSWKYIHRILLQTLHKKDTGESKLSEFL